LCSNLQIIAIEHQRQAAAQAAITLVTPAQTAQPKPARQSGAIENLDAARRTAKYLDDKGIRQTDFAKKSKISVRTLRSFLKTGKLRKNSLSDLCKALKLITAVRLNFFDGD